MDEAFDPKYKGSKDRLSNFRNYANFRLVTIRPFFPYTNGKSLYGYDISWTKVRYCMVSWFFEANPLSPTIIAVERNYKGICVIRRSFLTFDLEGLIGTAIAVTLRLRRQSSIGTGKSFNIYRAGWTDPLQTSDACSAIADLLSGATSGYTQGDSSYVYTIVADAGDLITFNSLVMNTKLSTVLVHRYDHDNILPDLGDEFNYAFYKGDQISQSLVWNTELRITYVGYPILNARPELINVSASAQTAVAYVSANDENNWSATVEDSPGWISLVGATGTGSYKFDVEIDENTDIEPREAVIIIQSEYIDDVYIDVYQVRGF